MRPPCCSGKRLCRTWTTSRTATSNGSDAHAAQSSALWASSAPERPREPLSTLSTGLSPTANRLREQGKCGCCDVRVKNTYRWCRRLGYRVIGWDQVKLSPKRVADACRSAPQWPSRRRRSSSPARQGHLLGTRSWASADSLSRPGASVRIGSFAAAKMELCRSRSTAASVTGRHARRSPDVVTEGLCRSSSCGVTMRDGSTTT